MKAGDLIFVRGNSIISKAVRFFDPGRFSHVAIAVSPTHVIETNWNMRSRIVEFSYEDFELVRLNLSDRQREQIPAAARELEGRFYDYLQILAYIFKSRVNNPRFLICSELVYRTLLAVGFAVPSEYEDATPNEMYAFFKAREGV